MELLAVANHIFSDRCFDDYINGSIGDGSYGGDVWVVVVQASRPKTPH